MTRNRGGGPCSEDCCVQFRDAVRVHTRHRTDLSGQCSSPGHGQSDQPGRSAAHTGPRALGTQSASVSILSWAERLDRLGVTRYFNPETGRLRPDAERLCAPGSCRQAERWKSSPGWRVRGTSTVSLTRRQHCAREHAASAGLFCMPGRVSCLSCPAQKHSWEGHRSPSPFPEEALETLA